MVEIEGYLKTILDDTSLSQRSKEVLLNEAMNLYEGDIKSIRYDGETKANVALYLACDKYSCAIPGKIPLPKFRLLSKIRKETGIKRREPIERIDSMCNLMDVYGDCIPKTTKNLLEIYKGEFLKDYNNYPPLGTAAGAIYIASKLCNEPITQKKLHMDLGVNEGIIRKRYKEIAGKLNLGIKL